MMNRFKIGLFFSLICYVLIVILNAFAWVVIEFIPFLIHGEYPFYKSQGGVFLLFFPLIFIFSIIFGVKKTCFVYPSFYFILSIFIMLPSSIEAWDAMYLFNFEFSKWSYIIYELIRKTGFSENSIVNLIIFNGIFFIYQIVLLLFSNRIFERLKSIVKISDK